MLSSSGWLPPPNDGSAFSAVPITEACEMPIRSVKLKPSREISTMQPGHESSYPDAAKYKPGEVS
ncbi:hypothetical protein D3C72_2571040 [compost metagenome]